MVREQNADIVSSEPAQAPDRQAASPTWKGPETSVIIPAYNEEEGLPVVLTKVCEVTDGSFEILVVDDGSWDRTQEVAKQFPCRIIAHTHNQGKGEAIKTGIKHARGANVIFIDADDTYPAAVVPEIAGALETFDMVVASRVAGKDNIPAFNRIGNAVFRNSIRHFYGFKAYDPLTGLYGIRKAHLERMRLESGDFGIEAEIATKAATMGLETLDIPIEYGTRIGQAKLHGLKDGYSIFRTILKHMFLYSPIVSCVFPGLALLLVGLVVMIRSWSGHLRFSATEDAVHYFAFSAMAALVGYQVAVLGLGARLYAIGYRFTRPGIVGGLVLRNCMQKMIIAVGTALALLGLGLVGLRSISYRLSVEWWALKGSQPVVLASFLVTFGIQMLFSGLFLSMLGAEVTKDFGESEGEHGRSPLDT